MCRFAFVKRDKLLAELLFLIQRAQVDTSFPFLCPFTTVSHIDTCSAISRGREIEKHGRDRERETTHYGKWRRKKAMEEKTDSRQLEHRVASVSSHLSVVKRGKYFSFCTCNTFTLTHGRKNMAKRRKRGRT